LYLVLVLVTKTSLVQFMSVALHRLYKTNDLAVQCISVHFVCSARALTGKKTLKESTKVC